MPQTNRTTVVGVFNDRDQAERAVDELHRIRLPRRSDRLRTEPVEYSAKDTPLGDEPWTEEDELAWQKSEEDIRRGDVVSFSVFR